MKRVRVFLCGATLLCLPAYAGMGVIHKIDPNTTRSVWSTATRQGIFADQATPTPLLNSDAINGLIVLASSGNYKVVEDLTYRIVITASSVVLDLGTHRASLAVGSQNVIAIANNLTNISIFDGYIQNTDVGTSGGSGVYVGAGCSKISLRDITFYGCTNGVLCAGSNGSQVFESEFIGLNFISNVNGLALSYADANVVRECNAMNCTQAGFSFSNCQVNCVEDCVALKTQGTGTVAGFQSSAGTSNLFQRCVTKQTKTSSTTFGDKACGFLLSSVELKTKIVDCIVNETDVVSSPTAMTYGIHLSPSSNGSLNEMAGFPRVAVHSNYKAGPCRFSPDGRFFAFILARGDLVVELYAWNGATATYLGTTTISATPPVLQVDIAWSPDGKYLVALDPFNQLIYSYSFDGSALALLGSGVAAGITPTTLNFSPNGKYLAVAGFISAGNQWCQLYSFTPSAGTPLAQLQSINLGGSVASWQDVSWSPDGKYLVTTVGGVGARVYQISPENVLTSVVTYPMTGVLAVRWSPCGKYIGAADNTGTLKILIFDGSTLSAPVQATGLSSGNIYSLAWSPDGKYITVGGGYSSSGNNRVWVLSFTGSALSVINQTAASLQYLPSVEWSCDGNYILSSEAASNPRIHMFNVMYGPQNCLVDNCRVCDTQASNFNMGRGIVFGGNNVCVRSACGNNNVNYSWGIPNVYDGKFEILRGVVQPYDNVSMPESL